VAAEIGSELDWHSAQSYAPLLLADRSLFAWEWLRRDPQYRAAAERTSCAALADRPDRSAEAFGLVAFERPQLGVPHGRPMWRSDVHLRVLAVERCAGAPRDSFLLEGMGEFATLMISKGTEHLLLSDGLRAIRLDGPAGTFGEGPVSLRYRISGLATAEPLALTLRRFLALARSGRFAVSLHPREPRARRWVLALRTCDALTAGASQRNIAEVLLSRSVTAPNWRVRESSVRSQVQRLVRNAASFSRGQYRSLL
jgi:hypothetical protein